MIPFLQEASECQFQVPVASSYTVMQQQDIEVLQEIAALKEEKKKLRQQLQQQQQLVSLRNEIGSLKQRLYQQQTVDENLAPLQPVPHSVHNPGDPHFPVSPGRAGPPAAAADHAACRVQHKRPLPAGKCVFTARSLARPGTAAAVVGPPRAGIKRDGIAAAAAASAVGGGNKLGRLTQQQQQQPKHQQSSKLPLQQQEEQQLLWPSACKKARQGTHLAIAGVQYIQQESAEQQQQQQQKQQHQMLGHQLGARQPRYKKQKPEKKQMFKSKDTAAIQWHPQLQQEQEQMHPEQPEQAGHLGVHLTKQQGQQEQHQPQQGNPAAAAAAAVARPPALSLPVVFIPGLPILSPETRERALAGNRAGNGLLCQQQQKEPGQSAAVIADPPQPFLQQQQQQQPPGHSAANMAGPGQSFLQQQQGKQWEQQLDPLLRMPAAQNHADPLQPQQQNRYPVLCRPAMQQQQWQQQRQQLQQGVLCQSPLEQQLFLAEATHALLQGIAKHAILDPVPVLCQLLTQLPSLPKRQTLAAEVLFVGAEAGNAQLLEKLLAVAPHGVVDMGVAARGYVRPLVMAAGKGDVQVVKLLAKHGAKLEAQPRDCKPLQLAPAVGASSAAGAAAEASPWAAAGASADNAAAVASFCAAAAAARDEASRSCTSLYGGGGPLFVAAQHGRVEAVKLLIYCGVKLDSSYGRCGTHPDVRIRPLHAAVRGGHVEVVELLLAGGSAVSLPGDEGWSPIHEAVCFGGISSSSNGNDARGTGGSSSRESKGDKGLAMLQLLLLLRNRMGGGGLNACHAKYGTALAAAAARVGVPRCISDGILQQRMQLLIDRGADLELRASAGAGLRALQMACSSNMVWFLLSKGAKPWDPQDGPACVSTGADPLLVKAVKWRDLGSVQVLLDRGVPVDDESYYIGSSSTPLGAAAELGEVDIAVLLLDMGAEVDRRGRGGRGCRPLQLAVKAGNSRLVQLLLDKGAAVERWGDGRAAAGCTVWQEASDGRIWDLLAAAKEAQRDKQQLKGEGLGHHRPAWRGGGEVGILGRPPSTYASPLS